MATASVISRKLRVSNRRFLSMCLILGAFLLLVRIYDMVIVSNFWGFPSGSFLSHIYGIGYDFLLFLRICLWMFLPMVAIGYYSRIWQKIIFTAVAFVIILSNLLLVQYFAIARMPLGADIFAYTKSEIHQTLTASGQLGLANILPFALFGIAILLAFPLIRAINFSNGFKRTFTIFIIFSLFIGNFLNPYPEDYNNEFQMYVASNKLSYFNRSVGNYIDSKIELNIMDDPAELTLAENTFEYVNTDFPLLHKENTPDALGSYFNITSTPPSFVFVIVESLGRAYSGQHAYLGSFTPFLDSLMEKSLYWENNLSTSGRTFQVLPSVMGSLPFGEKGFSEMGDQMPDHLTMISLLKKKAGYRSSFYYGGEAPFDNMEAFMQRQGIDKIVDQEDFESFYSRLPAGASGFSWGYGDKEIFTKYLNDLRPDDSLPRIDVMLTLAMHDPFRMPNQEYYNQKALNRMEELRLNEKLMNFNKNYIPQFAAIMYFDDALKGFITDFSKRKGYENTIFIITGDHRMPEIPISTQIDRFHVPLVIYSPMLKKGEKFSSLVSHFDVAPSLLSFLQHNYGIRQPSLSAWIGHGLDTSTFFRSSHAYPLMRNKNEFMDYIDGEDFLSGETIYRIDEKLGSEPQRDNYELKVVMKDKFDNFRRINTYVTRKNRLIPDSLKIN